MTTAGGVADLQHAAATFEACGVGRYRKQAELELRSLGEKIHRRTEPGSREGKGTSSLSGRELEVVRLVVDRFTNPEIAAALFLSLKTVETHMRNIFSKLGATSRVEVARLAERANLLHAPEPLGERPWGRAPPVIGKDAEGHS